MISLLLVALLQTPANEAPVQPQAERVEEQVQAPVVAPVILPIGGIEAPTQPTGSSSAAYTREARTGITPNLRVETGLMVRVDDIMAIRGQENNTITGIGLVTGLAATGDSGGMVKTLMRNHMLGLDLNIPEADILTGNIAVVTLDAVLPPGIKPGRQVSLTVACMGDATSLFGGQLRLAYLKGADGRIYGTGSGSLLVGGFSASADGATATTNHTTVARVSRGCTVQREVASKLVSDHGFIYLDSEPRKGSLRTSVKITDAINTIYPGAAVAMDPLTVRVTVPDGVVKDQHVAFLDSILRREIIAESFPRIVVNERTGVIVIGEGVRIGAGAVTKGNLTVTIAEAPEASQPGPLSGGNTEVLPRSQLVVSEENRAISVVKGAANLNEVVEVLNVLGLSPRDMIQILESMYEIGMLHAEIISL
jgi:flagellar P-ring protein precursor FlgI